MNGLFQCSKFTFIILLIMMYVVRVKDILFRKSVYLLSIIIGMVIQSLMVKKCIGSMG